MSFQVDKLLVPGFRNVDVGLGLYTYTFIFYISSYDKLPPHVYCDVIRAAGPIISRNYSIASIWIQVDAPGRWYANEIRRGLSAMKVPVAVTRRGDHLRLADFNRRACTSDHRIRPPMYESDWVSPVNDNQLACLRVLARLQHGMTSEIASLAGFSKRTAQYALGELKQRGYIEQVDPYENKTSRTLYSRKYSYWTLKRSGLKIALRSWDVPPGAYIPSRLETEHGLGEVSRHKITARRWLAWLKKALGSDVDIWDGWTEVRLSGMRFTPDALVWGSYEGHETLFWLEVESGHDAGWRAVQKIDRRFKAAVEYSFARDIFIVFALLTRPWLRERVARSGVFLGIPRHTAVIAGDWMEFGQLPEIEWGREHFVVYPK